MTILRTVQWSFLQKTYPIFQSQSVNDHVPVMVILELGSINEDIKFENQL
jgi:hypothetical protein